MLLRAINPLRLTARHERRNKTSAKVLLVQPHIICSHVIGVMTLEARGHPHISNYPMRARAAVAAVGIKHMAGGTSLASVLAPTRGTSCIKVASHTRAPEQIVAQVGRLRRMGDLFQASKINRRVIG